MGTNSGSNCTASITDVAVASLLSVIRDDGINSGNDNNQQLSIDFDFNYLVCAETKSSEIQIDTNNMSLSRKAWKKRRHH